MRQDRNGVRTAQDLERKYNLAELSKSVKLNNDRLNKTNSTLDDFIHATIGSLETFEGIQDGNITTYYSSGVPTVETYPANNWSEEEYQDHIDDLYYDKDTGYAYVFSLLEDGSYGWERTSSKAIIQALAIANSASDTADGKRRVFTETPVTPYENGDMWFKDGEIYICQVTKNESESYEEKDFIIATKYTDDSYAQQVGEKLEVLKGTVLTIEESVNRFKAEIKDLDQETASSLELLKNELQVEIQDAVYELVEVNGDLQSKYNLITKYFTFDVNGLTIGQVDSPYKVVIDNDRYSMMVNGVEVMWISNGEVHTPEITIERKINMFGCLIDMDEEGRVNCEYIPTVVLVDLKATYDGGKVAVDSVVSDLTGIKVEAYYSDGSIEEVTNYTLSGSISAEGENTIRVTYDELTTTFKVDAIVVGEIVIGNEEECQIATWVSGVGATNHVTVYYSDSVESVDGEVVLVNRKSTNFYRKGTTDYSKNDYNCIKGKYVQSGVNGVVWLISTTSSYTHETNVGPFAIERIVYKKAQKVTVTSV